MNRLPLRTRSRASSLGCSPRLVTPPPLHGRHGLHRLAAAAAALCAHAAVLAQGAPAELLDNPDVRRVYLGDAFRL